MKYLLLLALFASWLVSGGAFAQAPACYPWEAKAYGYERSNNPTDFVEWLAAPADNASFTISWWCDVKYYWKPEAISGWKDNLLPEWQATLTKLRSMSKAEIDKLWTDNVNCNAGKPTPECSQYDALYPIAKRQLEARRPPFIQWVVRQNPGSTSRPVFSVLTGGVRSATAAVNERVKVGELCKCPMLAIEEPVSGTDAVNSYCSVQGLDNVATSAVDQLGLRVAWCVRK